MKLLKKFALCSLSIGLMLSSFQVSAMADGAFISAAGITNSINGADLSKANYISRAQFAKMLVTFTKDERKLKSLSKKTLFKDVKKTNAYMPYINLAARSGYLSGYTNKKFGYKKKVTMGMAAYSCLKVLGYENSDLINLGSDGIMAKFNSLQLNKNIGKPAGAAITGEDAANLFYNLLSAPKKDTTTLGKALGYELNADGSIDTSSLLNAGNKISIAAMSGSLNSGMVASKIFRNGKKATASDIQKMDLLYYNKDSSTVYAYSERVYGTLSQIDPSDANPKNIVVGGQTLELAKAPIGIVNSANIAGNVWKTLFLQNDIEKGSFVTAIKDMNGKVVSVYKQPISEDKIMGYVVKNTGKKVSNDKDGFDIANVMTIITTANNELEVKNPNVAIGTGNIVSVVYDNAGVPIVRIENNNGGSLSGKILADDLRAVEVSYDLHAPVYKGLLSSLDLSKITAEYIGYNKKGEVNELILKDVTGEAYKYGIITEFRGDTIGYMIGNDKSVAEYAQGFYLDPSKEAVALGFKENKLDTVKPLNSVRINKITGNVAITSNGNYLIADNINVYYKSLNEWKSDKVKDMNDIVGHNIKGYYPGNSNIIRLIIIEK